MQGNASGETVTSSATCSCRRAATRCRRSCWCTGRAASTTHCRLLAEPVQRGGHRGLHARHVRPARRAEHRRRPVAGALRGGPGRHVRRAEDPRHAPAHRREAHRGHGLLARRHRDAARGRGEDRRRAEAARRLALRRFIPTYGGGAPASSGWWSSPGCSRRRRCCSSMATPTTTRPSARARTTRTGSARPARRRVRRHRGGAAQVRRRRHAASLPPRGVPHEGRMPARTDIDTLYAYDRTTGARLQGEAYAATLESLRRGGRHRQGQHARARQGRAGRGRLPEEDVRELTPMPASDDASTNAYWGRDDLERAIDAALVAAGKDLAALTIDDLAPVDHFHGGGKPSTVRLAQLAGCAPACACSTWAAGSAAPRARSRRIRLPRVVVDLTASYVQVGERLTARLGFPTASVIASRTRWRWTRAGAVRRDLDREQRDEHRRQGAALRRLRPPAAPRRAARAAGAHGGSRAAVDLSADVGTRRDDELSAHTGGDARAHRGGGLSRARGTTSRSSCRPPARAPASRCTASRAS